MKIESSFSRITRALRTHAKPLLVALATLCISVPLVWAESTKNADGLWEFKKGDAIKAVEVNENFKPLWDFMTAYESAIAVDKEAKRVGIGMAPSAATLDVAGTINGSYEGFSYVLTSSTFHELGWGSLIVPTKEWNTFPEGSYDINSSTFTAPKSGYYRFMSHGFISTPGTADERIAVGIKINGGLHSFSGGQFSAVDTPVPSYVHVVQLNKDDQVQLQVFTAIACNVSSSNSNPGHFWWFQGEYLGR